MYTLLNYDARDFLVIMEQVKAKVHDTMYKKLNEGLDHPDFYPEFIQVYAKVKGPDGKGINLHDSTISSIDINPDETKVYKSHSKSLCGEIVKVNILFVAKHIHCNRPDVANIGDTPRTFNTYESFLQFITESYKMPDYLSDKPDISVFLYDKNTGIGIYEVFRNLRKKDGAIPTLTEDEFTTLEGYSKLSQETKNNVDKVLCPLTVAKDGVLLINTRGWFSVCVDKQEFINEHLSITDLDGDIIPMISK